MTVHRYTIAFVLLAACGGDLLVFRTDVGTDSTDSAPDSQTCTQLQTAASSQWSAFASENSSCEVDGDCQNAHGSCSDNCPETIIATSASSAATALHTQICNQLAAEGCTPVPTQDICFVMVPFCNAGTCSSHSLASDAGTDTAPDAQTCTDLQTAARNSLGATVIANQSCSTNADCTFTGGECFTVCSAYVTNVTSSADVTSQASHLCQQLANEGCPITNYPPPPCAIAPDAVLCNNGTCIGAYACDAADCIGFASCDGGYCIN